MTGTTTKPNEAEAEADASAPSAIDAAAGDVGQLANSESSVHEFAMQESAAVDSANEQSVALSVPKDLSESGLRDSTSQLDPALLARIVEAALLAAQQPLSVAQLQSLFADDAPVSTGDIGHALHVLREACDVRGVELIEVASGFRYQVRSELQPWVARLWTERQAKYSRATLETLALIAYRQPITRGEIEQVRGVAVNSNLIKTLEEREWIRVVGHRDVPGKPELLGTTRAFLDYFGLKSLDALPPLSELHEIPELDPQLPFDTAPMPAVVTDDSDDLDTQCATGAVDVADLDDDDLYDVVNHDSGDPDATDDDAALVMASSLHVDADAIDSDSSELSSTDDHPQSSTNEFSDSGFSESHLTQSDDTDPQEHTS